MKTTKELQDDYDALLNEYEALQELIKDAEIAKDRIDELENGWHSKGLISKLKEKLEESKYPILKKDNSIGQRNIRIINVDKKWITLKTDGFDGKIRYKIETGWRERRERSRYENDLLDIKKALEIWENHQKNIVETVNIGSAIK